MRIKSVEIENFGCIAHVKVEMDGYTALIGPNNAGKSTILKAIDKFFSSTPKIDLSHHFRRDFNNIISITIEFHKLTPVEQGVFGSAVIDGRMTVTRTFGGEHDGLYVAEALKNPDFVPFQEETNGTKQRGIYGELRKKYGLAAASTVPDMIAALEAWEKANPDQLQRTKIRGFFGAPNVASGKLRTKTSLRFIPAVVDVPGETGNPKGSTVVAILADIRKQTLENKPEYRELLKSVNESVARFVDGAQDERVEKMSGQMTELLNRYYADTQIAAELPPADEIAVSFPSPSLKVRHRDIVDDVGNLGHGLQRAVLFAVVQFLAQHFLVAENEQAAGGDFVVPASDIIVLIEEPEIYQHPLKQRIIREVLEKICSDFDKKTGIRLQVVICTHSEKFVSIKNLAALRIVRTYYQGGQHRTSVHKIELEELRDRLFEARGSIGERMPMGTFAASMHIFSDAVSEGFFADKVILVEGVGDVAALEGAYLAAGRDPRAQGIAIIETGGKTNLDKPLQAFRSLGIKSYCVFDNDVTEAKPDKKERRRSYNAMIQRICGIEDVVDFPDGVSRDYAAFGGNIERYIAGITGEKYDQIRNEVAASFGYGDGEGAKAPATISALLSIARQQGFRFDFLDDIMKRVDEL